VYRIHFLQSVVTKYSDGVKISVYAWQIISWHNCTIVRRNTKEWPQLTVMATWKGFRIQTLYSAAVLPEEYISLLLHFKDRSSTFFDKVSVDCARPAHISVHLHLNCHRLRFGFCERQIAFVKRGLDWARIDQLVYWLATDCTVRESNSVGARIFATAQTDPGAHPASYERGCW